MSSTQVKDEPKLDGTRQLLDELDALMDQMLALPISDHDDSASASPQPAPTVSATVTMLDTPNSRPNTDDVARAPIHVARIDMVVDQPPASLVAKQAEDPSPTATEPVTVPIITDVAAPASLDLTLPPVVSDSRWRPDHISYQFLLWVNQGYDNGTTWLGRPGRFLRSSRGKSMLAIAGLALFGGALAWIAKDVLGWNW